MDDPKSAEVHTIAAIASPSGTGAISLVRLSGPQAIAIAERAVGGALADHEPRRARLCCIRNKVGEIVDEGLITLFCAPHSYTGEDTVEFTGHGGLLVTREVLARFLECGAQAAEAGEFTKRAYLNGRLDLTQAEGVMDVISAQTRLALRAAHSQLEGRLGKETATARDALLECLAHLEAWIDFPEEDIDPRTGADLLRGVESILEKTRHLLGTADQGRILREGVRTVICGTPNVGKSSLLNHLMGWERAIVSEQAGTTRDTIEETINLEGIPLRLIDTAGMRRAEDRIEAQGIQRTMRQIEDADLILEVFDASIQRSGNQGMDPGHAKHLLILNKIDLGEHPSWNEVDGIRISCQHNEGFEKLSAAIRSLLHCGDQDWGEHLIAINARHQQCLHRAAEALQAAIRLMQPNALQAELAAIDLREALDALGEIPGRVDTDDLLGVIFSSFCIGK